jgi:chromosome segregation ATPase
MLSNWYMEELQKAILGYRETIAALEDIKRNLKPCERNAQRWEEADARIRHLKQSITALQSVLPSPQAENSSDPLKV